MDTRNQSNGSPPASQATGTRDLIALVTRLFPDLSPQLKQAAKRVLEAPEDVAMLSMRSFARDAGVPPSTMVRLARALGFASYDEFRAVFQAWVRTAGTDFASRAEWLQQLPEGGRDHQVVAGMASAITANVEMAFRGNELATLTAAANTLRTAKRVWLIGVGGMHPLAAYMYYVARMALPDVRLAAPQMATMIDELTDLGPEDAAAVLSVAPYATETMRTAQFIHQRKASLIAITDSRLAPVAPLASCLLLVPTATPQFFPSQAATITLLETLTALIVSHGDARVLERIARVDTHRREAGIYWDGD
jgi:DNA-binding MurR/RpiR family transcriptional regulator